jgi:NAD(P)-dependent dehydrogenase (short-subunit alcohol dehydrogenase family)
MAFWIICVCIIVLFLVFEWVIRQLKIGNYKSRYVLITGCDSGFGNELAKQLEALGFNVLACCLTKSAVENFNKMSSPKLKAIEMDVTKDASIEKALEIVRRTLPEGKGKKSCCNFFVFIIYIHFIYENAFSAVYVP